MKTKTAIVMTIVFIVVLFALPVFHFMAFGVLIYFVVNVTMAMTHDGDLLLMLYEKWGQDGSKLQGKVVWITGASSGIGEALSYQFARKGLKLILSARREKELQRVKERCLKESTLNNEDILVLPMDARDYESHQGCAEKAVGHFQKVDILVNNAGRSQRSLTSETSFDVDKAIIDLNLLGVLSVTKAIMPHMLARKEGHVVNVSSVSGRVPIEAAATYSATKHALMGYFGSFAYENDVLNVTNVCPGPVQTNNVRNAFGQNLNSDMAKVSDRLGARGTLICMTAERCASLIVVAVANKLPEVWICKNHVMLMILMYQWAPMMTYWIRRKVYGTTRIAAISKAQKGA